MPFKRYIPRVVSPETQRAEAQRYFELMQSRRTVRDFSSRPLPDGLLELLIATACTAPSGANKQPWTFVIVTDQEIKKQIRSAAEEEERTNYGERFPEEWLQDLAALGTDWHKPFLEEAPALIVVFRQDYALTSDGKKQKHYYVSESVGIACGFLLCAIHNAGLVALTHTPSPMGFLHRILDRPANEKPYLLIPVGYPKNDAEVPDIQRKPPDAFIVKK